MKKDNNIVELQEKNEEYAKMLLSLEIVLGYTACLTFLASIFVASYIEMDNIYRVLLIVFGSAVFAIGVCKCLKIEQSVGYYECQKCNHKHIPTYFATFWAPHFGRTRYMSCPNCGEKSWHKKVIK